MILIVSSEMCGQSVEAYSKTYTLQTPGNSLISFTKIYYTGFAIQVVGAGLIGWGQLVSEEDNQMKEFTYFGVGLVFIGSIAQLISVSCIGKAGQLLNEQQKSNNKNVSINIEPTQYGIGIVCRF